MSELVLVASGGGHLEQLKFLSLRFSENVERRWVTFDSPQSRSLLKGEDVTFVPYMGPRDYLGLGRNLRIARELSSTKNTKAIVSTGSGLALAYLPMFALRGIPAHYIESATRVFGPSLTGRILAKTPGVRMQTQYQNWADDKWEFKGSVFDGFEAVDQRSQPQGVRKVVVSLGTIKPYGFRRLIERLVGMLGSDVEVVWQTGATDVGGLPIKARPEIPHHELFDEIQSADLLVAHAGTGIALTAFRAGVRPLLVPRESVHGEHVDDHQKQIAKVLGDAGLAISRTVESISPDDFSLTGSKIIVPGSPSDASPLEFA